MDRFVIALTVIVALGACTQAKRYELEGQIVAIDHARQELTVRHRDIKGFMPAMTMPFRVGDSRVLKDRKPGELIKGTLVVSESTGWLEDVRRTGEAPLPPDALRMAAATALQPGTTVADAEFVDQAGRRRRLSEWRGKALAVTFVYTRCPLPDFCPLMDRNFATVQRTVEADQRLAGRVHLASVSFDPEYDSPEVLRAYARKAGAHEKSWTWLTGEAAAIDRFAAQFGTSIVRGDRPLEEITHNLRTVVIDPKGRLVKIYAGNEWKPEELLETLRTVDGG